MLIYYIRHGEPIYNPDQLTPTGHEQAASLAHRMVHSQVDTIYASPSTRAMQTAAPTAEALHLPITTLDWLNESHAWEEFTTRNPMRWIFHMPELIRLMNSNEIRDLGFRWYEHPTFASLGCADGVRRMRRCVDEFLADFGLIHDDAEHSYHATDAFAEFDDRRLALFAHDGAGRLFLSTLLDLPYPYLSRFEMNYTGMTVIRLRVDDGGTVIPKLLQYDSDSHWYKDGLPTNMNNGIWV